MSSEETKLQEIQERFYEGGLLLPADMEWLLEMLVQFFEFLCELEELADQPEPVPIGSRLVVIPGWLRD